jgi:hypothetical protein
MAKSISSFPIFFGQRLAMFCGKAFGGGDGPGGTAEGIASEMQAQNFSTMPSRTLITEALRIGLAYDRPLYDCLYVALAIRSRSQMITADERLANALAAYLPVKWLGAL